MTRKDLLIFPGPGIVYDMPAHIYHQVDAVSSTQIKTFAVSPWHEYTRRQTPVSPTPAMLLGTATHTATLEPEKLEKQFIIAEPCIKCGNKGRTLSGGKWYCGHHDRGIAKDPIPQVLGEDGELLQGIIAEGDLIKAKKMARAIRSHQVARAMLTSPTARFEVSIFWYETVNVEIDGRRVTLKIPCKARLDIYDPSFATWGPSTADIKTCQSSFVADFEKDISERRYDLQAVWYNRGAMQASGGLEHKYFTFLPIESTPTHISAAFRCHAEMMSYAEDELFGADGILERLAICEARNAWPTYPGHGGILVCNLPQWHHRNEERERKRDNRL